MAKDTMKAMGIAAAESALKAMMPHMQETLTTIRDDVRGLRDRIELVETKLSGKIDGLDARIRGVEDKLEVRIDALRQEMFDRFEATRDTINELGQRISRVDGALEAHTRIVHAQFPPLLARTTPTAPAPRKRRAG